MNVSIVRILRERKQGRRVAAARGWPTTEAKVNGWKVVPADEAVTTPATPYQIEASFSFVLNGEYYGGYLKSVGMTHHQAEMMGVGDPSVVVRYDSGDPDQVVVLGEDNLQKLPFAVISG